MIQTRNIAMTTIYGLRRALRAVSFVLLLKGVVGGAATLLALFGVIGPHFLGYPPTGVEQGAAASVGAIIGALLALKG